MSLATQFAGAIPHVHKPRREKMFGEGRTDPARPQRQGQDHGATPAR